MKTSKKIFQVLNCFEALYLLNNGTTNTLAVCFKPLFRSMHHEAGTFANTMLKKTLTAVCLIGFTASIVSAQAVTPCNEWLTGYIAVGPKMSDGESISAYVTEKLQSDTSLKSASNCMVGLKISVNCKGEFSYEKMVYPNSPLSGAQCSSLLQTTEHIVDGIKLFAPGTIDNQEKDFVFKLVVRVTHNGKAKTEILY